MKVPVGVKNPMAKKSLREDFKEKANNNVLDLVTTQLNELKNTNIDMNEIFKDFIITAKEEKAQKKMMREQMLRAQEDRIMVTDTSTMTFEQAAYYEQRRVETIQMRLGHSSSTQ